MAEMPDEPGRTKLPPELARLRAIDQELHIQAGKRAGLDEAQAVAHAGEHMEERARDEYRAPAKPRDAGSRPPARRRGG